MRAFAMIPATDAADLEALTAALLHNDPLARVLERSGAVARLRTGEGAVAVLVRVDSLDALAGTVREALAAQPKGTVLRVVAIDAARLGATQTLKAEVGALQVRSVVQAFSWVPGTAPEVARGGKWPLLQQAVQTVSTRVLTDPEAVIAERAQRGAEVDGFMATLQKRPVVTFAVAALSVVLFALQLWWGNGEPVTAGVRMGAGVPSLIEAGELWRLLAPMALHGNFFHLLMNMVALLSFGTFLERFLGWQRYLSLYVLAGLGGCVASALRPHDVVSVGASGGIWGLMLAGAVLVTWPSGRLPHLLATAQRRRAWTPVVINGLYSLQPGIDLLAHFGGGLIGALTMLVMLRGLPRADEAGTSRRAGMLANVVAIVCGAALLAAIAVSLGTGRPWQLLGRPTLTATALPGEGASVELPPLLGPRIATGEPHQFLYGRLSYDPVAFVVTVFPARLDENERLDPKGALQGLVDALNQGAKAATPFEGFTVVGKFAVHERAGRVWVQGLQTAPDGRRIEGFWVVTGDRLAWVQVMTAKATPPEWRALAQQVPFTLRFESGVEEAR